MRATRLAGVVIVAWAAGCSAPPDKLPSPPISADNHPFFPITAGTRHELGSTTFDGVIACESCHPPAAETFKEIACTSCHQAPITDRLHLSVTGYSWLSTACYSCHPAADKMAFDHAGINDGCAMCHDVGTRYAALPLAGFTHPETGGTDCAACHVTTTWKGATGAPPQPTHDARRDVLVTGYLPLWAGTSITSLDAQPQALQMEMNHGSPTLPTAAMGACSVCHVGSAAGAFYPGELHSSLANLTISQPATCSSCHGGAAPKGFVGATATSPARTPPSPEMRHDAVAWASGAPTTNALVTQDCGVCHSSPSQQLLAGWKNGLGMAPTALFHASLALGAQPQPSSCIDCHANTRPAALLTSGNSGLAAGLKFDHTDAVAQGDCQSCHAASAQAPFASWSGGKFHLPGSTSPASCVACHEGERPSSNAGWQSATYQNAPFDYGTNGQGITHGAGQECAVCHTGSGTGAWGVNQNWQSGNFTHTAASIAARTCISCHSTQRPDLQAGTTAAQMATLLGFDHSINGAGDCFGCHQATVTAGSYANYKNPVTNLLPGGDWKNGVPYPGSTLISAINKFITVNETKLVRNGTNFVTGSTVTSDTLYMGMLHVATAVPAALNAGPTGSPDNTKCWHCHTSTGTTVTSFNNGLFHASLTNYKATPASAVTALPQPTAGCAECHSSTGPKDIVEKAASVLVPMDHAAAFVSGTGVAQLDCSTCHQSPGNVWSDGVFHARISTAVPKDCVTCHYPLSADATRADVASATTFTMKHRSPQLVLQTCETCHTAALGKSTTTPATTTLWQTGALHPKVNPQPTACNECHTVSRPPASPPTQSLVSWTFALGGTATNGGQWMSHGVAAVAGKDCAVCHAADAKTSGSAWARSDLFHPAAGAQAACAACHGTTNGNAGAAGTGNNLPGAKVNSTTVTSASAATGVPAGTFAQMLHTDINAAGKECALCHQQQGLATGAAQGKEWAQARFHAAFGGSNPLILSPTTGRCSTCHLAEKPGTGYALQDHLTFTDVSGTQDCASCHSWPGTGSAGAPNWLGATGKPLFLSVGGFGITRPPATASTTQAGIANLPHPAGNDCTTCHADSAGGRPAKGYDHASPLIALSCGSCHEAGSDLVATPWNMATTMTTGAGDTRPFTLTSLVASYGNGLTVTATSHFYPVDCNQCHTSPVGTALNTSGAAYTTAWDFPHTQSKMSNPTTCLMCHVNGIPGAPPGPASDPNANVTVTAQVPRYTGTSIASFTAQSQTLPMEMVHSSTEIPAAAMGACTNCHQDAASGLYLPGLLHSSLNNLKLAQPTACGSCHGANASPNGFVGPVATSPARSPASPEMKHDAVAWDGGVPTSTALVPTNCGVCHTPPVGSTAGWAFAKSGATPAIFHAPLADAGIAQPGSCLDCHANTRPGALTSANAALPTGVTFDHQAVNALGDCQSCHSKSALAPWTSWSQGRFHLAGQPNPATCLPCHTGERPTSTAAWQSPTYASSPFDYVTNARAVTHGAGADCAVCHQSSGTGVWGSTQNWQAGTFTHGAGTLSANTCLTCHTTQRPDLQLGTTAAQMATLLGFDHSLDGTGDCVGCHQATVTAATYVRYTNPVGNTLPGGDWKNGVAYPGSTLVSADTQFITLTETQLNRTGALVTSTTQTSATIFNAMLHVSAQLPAALNAGPTGSPDNTKCWHCHTSTGTTVTSYKNGQYHASLTNYRATPASGITPFPQPTSCNDCHDQMTPLNVVQKAGSDLQAMDHGGTFKAAVTLGGVSVTRIDQADCSVCHTSPGVSWADGAFHAKIGAGQPSECVSCHYLLMADAARSDLTTGTRYTMKHRSAPITFQTCDTCHTAALGKSTMTPAAAPLWATGAYHGSLTTQPTVCNDCHSSTDPATSTQSSWTYTFALGGTTSNSAQWMSHTSTYVTGRDCAFCHLADAKKTGAAWAKADLLHTPVPSATTCNHCHGTTNGGGSVAGTNNNLPSGLTNSTMVSSAAGTVSGVAAGTLDQLTHTDVNVSAFECTVCHTQQGRSAVTGVQGKEWAQAKFHPNFTGSRVLVMNATTGRCSNCHLNVKPGTGYAAQDHSAFTNTSGSQDCSACHSWPGTGTTTAPNWKGAAGMPQYISVGGFTVPAPPAAAPFTQGGINNLPHPAVPTGTQCTQCHATASGGKNASGYDHLSTLINSNCSACHEAGSNLVGTPWNNASGTAAYNSAGSGAGDTRAFTLSSVTARYSGNTRNVTWPKHFYPVDCNQCHVVPAAFGPVTTGTAYISAWNFPHTTKKMTNPGTCVMCHTNGIPN